jgi:DNA (cytosine-5)-methyltransferase 1
VLENVTAMRHTVIDDGKESLRPILDVVFDALAPEYAGAAYDVEFADYGIPQRRQRLITILTRDCRAKQRLSSGESLIPEPTHARQTRGRRQKWVSVANALCEFPSLDAGAPATASHGQIPFHRVPVLDPKKYAWVKHTPPGRSAFDNQCISPACGYQGNLAHGAGRDADGINRARRDTPLFCQKCGALLPRPYVVEADGSMRIMSGYTSAYKRMDPDLPAPALTRNLSYPCSDQKLHPFEHRVLSLAEAIRLQTLDAYPYEWGPLHFVDGKGKMATDTLMRLVIGESVPPRFMELLGTRLVAMSSNQGILANEASAVTSALEGEQGCAV